MLSQQMTDEKFFEIMAQVYNIKLDEADEWDFINAAREDRALVMNDRSQLDNLKADMNTVQERIAALEAENERLRLALNAISLVDNENRLHDGLMQQIAREALQPEAE